jgi:hypothetical protein
MVHMGTVGIAGMLDLLSQMDPSSNWRLREWGLLELLDLFCQQPDRNPATEEEGEGCAML